MAEPRELPIEWNVPPAMRAEFANNLLVTHIDGQFVLTFFEAVFPTVLEGDTEGASKVANVPANAVCRLAVPPERIKPMIRALTRNYEKYEENSSSEAEED